MVTFWLIHHQGIVLCNLQVFMVNMTVASLDN